MAVVAEAVAVAAAWAILLVADDTLAKTGAALFRGMGKGPRKK